MAVKTKNAESRENAVPSEAQRKHENKCGQPCSVLQSCWHPFFHTRDGGHHEKGAQVNGLPTLPVLYSSIIPTTEP